MRGLVQAAAEILAAGRSVHTAAEEADRLLTARDRHGRAAIVVTDAAPSFDEQQAHRRHVYTAIMAVHVAGFAVSYPLYLWQQWAGVAMVVATGALPWVAVLLANDRPPRQKRRPSSGDLADQASE